MYRILIVDDEVYVQQSLKMTIPWETQVCVVVGCASSGAEALRLVDELRPDIVFTDIRMPGMDGLELTKRLKAAEPDLPVILLTGHADFGYAREALRVGAFAYCLKPFDEDELMATLKRACAFRAQVRSRLLADVSSVRSALEKAGALPRLDHPLHLIVVLSRSEMAPPSEWESLALRLDRLCRAFFIWNIPVMELRRWTSTLTEEGVEGWALQENCVNPVDLEATIARLHVEAYDWFTSRRESEKSEIPDGGDEDLKTLVGQGIREIQIGEYHRSLDVTRRIEAYFALGRGNILELRQALNAIHHFLDTLVPGAPSEDSTLECDGLVLKYSHATAALEALRERIAEHHSQFALAGVAEDGSATIRRIIAYLQNNYHHPLSLEDIAQACHLSATYASAIFKKETGWAITAFLNQLRVEQALRLIRETSYSLEVIAGRVGFSSYPYFCRVFKQYTGSSPGSYRNEGRIN